MMIMYKYQSRKIESKKFTLQNTWESFMNDIQLKTRLQICSDHYQVTKKACNQLQIRRHSRTIPLIVILKKECWKSRTVINCYMLNLQEGSEPSLFVLECWKKIQFIIRLGSGVTK
ncbi:hypothetical protein ACKWTF_001797 [Chironomus riparius]